MANMKLGGGGRFAALKKKLASKGLKNPAGAAAAIGRKKYGNKRFQALSKMGKKHEKMESKGKEMMEEKK